MKRHNTILFFFFFLVIAGTRLFAQQPITVALDGSGNFRSIQEAINSLPPATGTQRIIAIKKGVYHEKLFIDKDFITLKGEDPANTIVSIALARDEWRCSNPDDYGTATLNLKGNDINLVNLCFINEYGKVNVLDRTIACANDSSGYKSIKPGGHQMALRSFSSTRLIAINCIFRAYGGDTVSPWNTDNGMFYFKDCIMEGGVDFYCPRGWAMAEQCKFICHSKEAAIWHDGSGNELSKTVLLNCRFTGEDSFKLGRYHRDAQFYLLNCSFAANMADADIYQRAATPPNKIKWGKRVYFYNCHRDGGDYAWIKNNLPPVPGYNDITIAWTYDYKWNPISENNIDGIKQQYIEASRDTATDPVAENMLLYQRANGGWPKHFQGDRKVDYKRILTDEEKKELHSGYEAGMDATIDNDATTKEIRYLVKAFRITNHIIYLHAAERGVDYLLKAQYANGGWPQFFPDFSSYRSQITYNDNAMVNVLNVMMDIVDAKNDLGQINRLYVEKCRSAIQKGIDCILKTQIKQGGKLTAWCAQYNAKTLLPEMARKFELASLSGMESVGITRFLMRIDHPTPEIIAAVTGAVNWFSAVKILGHKFIDVVAPDQPGGKDRVFVADSMAAPIWARFYDLETNEPFFSGRDSQRKKTIAEVENERRVGYAWYGNWPEKLLINEFPVWADKWIRKIIEIK